MTTNAATTQDHTSFVVSPCGGVPSVVNLSSDGDTSIHGRVTVCCAHFHAQELPNGSRDGSINIVRLCDVDKASLPSASHLPEHANTRVLLLHNAIKEIPDEYACDNESLKYVDFGPRPCLERFGISSFARTNITRIVIPDNVKVIPSHCFASCHQLREVIFSPSSQLEEICDYAFSGTSLSHICIPDSVKYIGDQSFSRCKSLERVSIGIDSRLETIGSEAFSRTKLSIFWIPNRVKHIGEGCFAKCKSLTSVFFGSSVVLEKLGPDTFQFSGLKSIHLPDSLRTIERCCFRECNDLRRVTFGEHSRLESICEYAFIGDCSLRQFVLPANVTAIANSAFYCCHLMSSEFLSINKNFSVCNGCLINLTSESLVCLVESVSVAYVPDSVRELSRECLMYPVPISEVVFPEPSCVERICGYAFASTDITDITIPESATEIGEYCFRQCDLLETATLLPGSLLRHIGEGAFAWTHISEIFIPEHVEKIDAYAFAGTYITHITIPASVTEIGDCCFAECMYLETVTFLPGSRLKRIGKCAFAETRISRIIIPEQVVMCKGRKLNGAVSSPATPVGDLLSISGRE